MRQMSLWEEAPAKPSRSPASGRLWTIHAASSCSNISELAQRLIRNGSSGRTCPEYCRLNTDGLSSRSLKPWPNSGLMGGGAAWRVLDAQFFGVAQRRERVFLVVNTRDWRRAAPVLFERESLCWDSASSREKRETLTGGTANVIGNADSHVGECLTPGESQARRIELRPRADVDGARREGHADHIPVMTSNGDDMFPALCATDGSKRFIDNQSINGGRLLIDRRRT